MIVGGEDWAAFFIAPKLEQQIDVHDAAFINQKDALLISGCLLEGLEKECIVCPVFLALYDKLKFPFASVSDLSVVLISGNRAMSRTKKRPLRKTTSVFHSQKHFVLSVRPV